MKDTFLFLFILGFIISCTPNKSAQQIIDNTIKAHGSKLFGERTIAFNFRKKQYSLKRENDVYTYTRSFTDDSLGQITDVLVNSKMFERYVNDTLLNISEEWKSRYGSSINSVLYFFQLPNGLNDKAVNKEYLGQSVVQGKLYDKVQVTFQQDNGGDDFEDVFVYWLNTETNMLDYLAYSYQTDGGGVRFRQAINRRAIDGLVVQDYINFKPENKNIRIEALDKNFNEGTLIELSHILNENVTILP